MSIKTIHELGADKLVRAIVDRAAMDFMVTKPGSSERQEIENFFLSSYFETLTGTNGSVFLKRLQKRYIEKKARKGNKHDD